MLLAKRFIIYEEKFKEHFPVFFLCHQSTVPPPPKKKNSGPCLFYVERCIRKDSGKFHRPSQPVSCIHFMPPHLFCVEENELSPLSLIAAVAIRIHSRALITPESRSNPAFVCRDIQNCHHVAQRVPLRCVVMPLSSITSDSLITQGM